ncbi:MAG: response regulator transcription factor [Acidobacteriota bacterium]|nr:response regulator transcription factor [Acidobacteriota bacterium]
MIRVLIADDQALLRAGFRVMLDAEPDIEVVGEAADGAEAVELADKLAADVVLMDVRMPGVDGIDGTQRLLQRTAGRPRVLILTTFDHDEYLYDAIRAGASGFLLKNVRPDDLIHAVRAVHAGDTPLDSILTRRLLSSFASRPAPGVRVPDELAELTDRELEVLKLMARGLSNSAIATELVIAEATVKTHVGSVLHKLGLRDRVQAVVLAYEAGLVVPGSA